MSLAQGACFARSRDGPGAPGGPLPFVCVDRRRCVLPVSEHAFICGERLLRTNHGCNQSGLLRPGDAVTVRGNLRIVGKDLAAAGIGGRGAGKEKITAPAPLPWSEQFSETRYFASQLRNRMINELLHETVPPI